MAKKCITLHRAQQATVTTLLLLQVSGASLLLVLAARPVLD